MKGIDFSNMEWDKVHGLDHHPWNRTCPSTADQTVHRNATTRVSGHLDWKGMWSVGCSSGWQSTNIAPCSCMDTLGTIQRAVT